jgi:hypothetical protein
LKRQLDEAIKRLRGLIRKRHAKKCADARKKLVNVDTSESAVEVGKEDEEKAERQRWMRAPRRQRFEPGSG